VCFVCFECLVFRACFVRVSCVFSACLVRVSCLFRACSVFTFMCLCVLSVCIFCIPIYYSTCTHKIISYIKITFIGCGVSSFVTGLYSCGSPNLSTILWLPFSSSHIFIFQ
jgi:hypothetical protein